MPQEDAEEITREHFGEDMRENDVKFLEEDSEKTIEAGT